MNYNIPERDLRCSFSDFLTPVFPCVDELGEGFAVGLRGFLDLETGLTGSIELAIPGEEAEDLGDGAMVAKDIFGRRQ